MITDYSTSPQVSMAWAVDRQPITDYAHILMLLKNTPVAQPLPPLGVFHTKEINELVRAGVIRLTAPEL